MTRFWTPERVEDARTLREAYGTEEAARKLTKKLKRPVTAAALRGLFQRQEEGESPRVEVPTKEVPAAWQAYTPRERVPAPKAKPGETKVQAVRRGVVIPDTHVPLHSAVAWSAALGVIKEWKPDFGVIIGDFMDLEALSRHPKSKPDLVRLAEEYYATNLALDQLQNAAPSCDWKYIEGNHERRAVKFAAELGALDGLLSVPEQLFIVPRADGYFRSESKLRGMSWVPYEQQPYVTPHSAYYHGHNCTATHHAAYHANTYAPSRCHGKPLFYGHMHTFQQFRSASGNTAQCTGFLGDETKLVYTEKRPTPWQHGIVLQGVMTDGTMTYMPLPFTAGRALFHGKVVQRSRS